MRSARLLAVAVLAVVLALSTAQNAFATVTLAYDNGIPGVLGLGGTYWGVKFSLPSGVSSALLTYVRWAENIPSMPLPLKIIVTKADHVTVIGSPISLTGPGNNPSGIGCPPTWTRVPTAPECYGLSLTDYGIVVTGDFFVILNKVGTTGSLDNGLVSLPPDRSFIGDSLPGLVPLFPPDHNNFLLRVDVDPISPAAVGGIVMPVNTLAILGPWFAVIGLVVCIGTVVVVAKKREK